MIFLFPTCNKINKKPKSSDLIQVWYGENQKFGVNGNTQKQINILGNIRPVKDSLAVYYTLNDNNHKNWLTLGCDLHRLAKKGDFNIEIYRNELIPGNNLINIFATYNDTIVETKEVRIKYFNDRTWPLPYKIEWNNVENIQDVAEIIDGHWELVDSGIHITEKYYDRIIAIGDSTWKDYEVTTSVIFHDFTPPTKGPPTYNVTHVAIASRWPGHDIDSLQPHRKWFPLGATSEFSITTDYDSCKWEIFDGQNFSSEQPKSFYQKIFPETKYNLKHRVENISLTKTLYSVKFWNSEEAEPPSWDFQAIEESTHPETGSACLIAHHTDVTFGDVLITPIK